MKRAMRAITAERKVTGLNQQETFILAEEMLPFPILNNTEKEKEKEKEAEPVAVAKDSAR